MDITLHVAHARHMFFCMRVAKRSLFRVPKRFFFEFRSDSLAVTLPILVVNLIHTPRRPFMCVTLCSKEAILSFLSAQQQSRGIKLPVINLIQRAGSLEGKWRGTLSHVPAYKRLKDYSTFNSVIPKSSGCFQVSRWFALFGSNFKPYCFGPFTLPLCIMTESALLSTT